MLFAWVVRRSGAHARIVKGRREKLSLQACIKTKIDLIPSPSTRPKCAHILCKIRETIWINDWFAGVLKNENNIETKNKIIMKIIGSNIHYSQCSGECITVYILISNGGQPPQSHCVDGSEKPAVTDNQTHHQDQPPQCLQRS